MGVASGSTHLTVHTLSGVNIAVLLYISDPLNPQSCEQWQHVGVQFCQVQHAGSLRHGLKTDYFNEWLLDSN